MPPVVVASAEHFERFPRLAGAGVELPVHLLALQRLVEAFQQPEPGRRAVPDTQVRVVAVDVSAKRPCEKARAIVGDQKRGLREWPVQPLGFGPRRIERRGDVRRPIARREAAREQITRVVVDKLLHPLVSIRRVR